MKLGTIFIILAVCYINSTWSFPTSGNYTLEGIIEEYGRFINPEELGTDYQGDIIATEEEQLEMVKSGTQDPKRLWPKGYVVIDPDPRFTGNQNDGISRAIGMITSRTCIKFRFRQKGDVNYIKLTLHEKRCNSVIGMEPGKSQVVNIADWCIKSVGSVAHELIHAIGFNHEHTRKDRDDFVFINFENIKETARINWAIDKTSFAYKVPYDYGSIMHYGEFTAKEAAVDPNIKVILAKRAYNGHIGQRKGLSQFDAQKINKMYAKRCNARQSEEEEGFHFI